MDRAALRQLLNLPEHLTITHVVALGYAAESPREVAMAEGDVKYYLENGTLQVPKRALEDVLISVQ